MDTALLDCYYCEWSGSVIELIIGPNGVKCPSCKKHIPQDADGWISITNGLPETFGWYKIKTSHGEFEAPFVTNGLGKLVWVLPDPSIITHWKY